MLCLGSPNVWGLFKYTFVLLSERLEEFLWHAALNTALLKYLGHTARAVVMEHRKSVFCLLKETSKFCLRSTLLQYLQLVFRALIVRWNQASPVKNVKLRSSFPRKKTGYNNAFLSWDRVLQLFEPASLSTTVNVSILSSVLLSKKDQVECTFFVSSRFVDEGGTRTPGHLRRNLNLHDL
jgi:hypothetical protein